MLLITFNEWFGPGREEHEFRVDVSECQTPFVTDLKLPEALLRINAYETAHNAHYHVSAINFTLLSVSTIDYLNSEVRDKMNIQLIEDLPITVEEIP